VLRTDDSIEMKGNDLTIWFEYRPLIDEDESHWLKVYNSIEKSRKTLDRQARCIAFDEWIRNEIDGDWKKALSIIPKNKDRSLLYNKLNHYTGKNTTDYFIHKDLQSFLERELEYYLKNEVIRVDDFIEDDTDQAMEVALTRAKVVRNIGKMIIAFLSQIENFQKKLFEKRKFVVDTHYCFTLDRIPENLYDAILKNKKQLGYWEQLYAMDKWNGDLSWDGNWSRDLLKNHKFMMLDTRNFGEEFKLELLASFDDLDKELEGLLINGDNFQGLNLITKKYEEKIQAVYLDPPYNAEASEILYKNSFKHSSWLSLIATRFLVTKNLMNNNSKLCITIDDHELHHLAYALDYYFGEENYLGTVPIRNNPQGRSTVKGFSVNHEYGLFYGNNDGKNEVGRLEHSQDQIDRYNEVDDGGRRFLWENFRKTGTDSQRRDRPKQFYPIFTDGKGVRIPEMEWDDKQEVWKLLESCSDKEVEIFPIDSNGNERVWKWGSNRARNNLSELKAVNNNSDKQYEIYRKNYLNVKGSLPNTWWHDSKYAAGSHGTNLLTSIFGKGHQFSFPKSVFAVEDSLQICGLGKTGLAMDYFAGSGTTAHAVLNLNKGDNGERKYLLIEMGQYFDTVLKPRIQKVIYTNNWKDGIPQDQDGQSHAIKYHFIESYEDALNNINFKNPEDTQQAMEFEDYMLTYMLDFETQGVSASLLKKGAFETPFDYKLKIQRDHEPPKEEVVDLVETFHYLLGLWVQKIRQYEHQERKYVVSTGQIRNVDAVEDVCIIWRNTKDLNLDTEAKWIQGEIVRDQTFDRIYINGVNKVKDAEPIEITFREKMFEDVV